jgi:hypothetical protein
MSIRAETIIVILFTLLLTLPFINRPFHMDDAGFLELARVRQHDPTALTIHDYTFFGQENEIFLDTHPPFISSYLAVLISVAGTESEMALHLGFLIFPVIASVSMYFLARRYTRYAMLAAMLLMATPGMMVMSQGLMSDVPAVSLWLAAVTLYVYGLQRQSLGLMALCALVITTGVFTSYQVLSVLPLLLAYAVVRRQVTVLAVLPFVLPLSSIISYVVWHWNFIGALPRFSYGVGEPLAWYSLVQKGAGAMLALAGASIFFGSLVRVLVSLRRDSLVYLVVLVPLWVTILLQYFSGRYSAEVTLIILILLPLGMLLVYRIFVDGWLRLRQDWRQNRDRLSDDLLLELWLGGVLFYVIFLLPYSSVRYLLPLFAPLILLFMRLAEDKFRDSELRLRNFLVVGVMATAALGTLVSLADYELVGTYRDFAGNEASRIEQETSSRGGRVWFVGEFGFRYYMEQHGYSELPKDTGLPVGDTVIQAPLADPRRFSEELKDSVELVEIIRYPAILPVRVTSYAADAGFYGHFWGLAPFSVASGSVEEFLVYKVVEPKE